MAEPKWVSAEEVHKKLGSGQALLVCAYEDDQKFERNHLEGALSLKEFESKLPSLSKNEEIVFYCA